MLLPGRRLAAWLLAVVLLLCGSASRAADANAIVTILDGEATLIRGTARFGLAEGVRLQAGDIVTTAPAARLLRIELADGRALNLGGATQLLLAPHFTGGRRPPADAYLLQGWAKGNLALASAALDLREPGGKAVMHVQADSVQVFTESGSAVLEEHRADAAPVTLKPGQFFQRQGAAHGVAPRPSAEFIAQVPRPFLDTLPARAALFKARVVAPKPQPAPTYGDLQPWLDAEPALRRSYVSRWMPLARGEFRKALVADLRAHREWERILFPERFQRPSSSPAR